MSVPPRRLPDGKYHVVGEVGPVPASVQKAKLRSLAGRLPSGHKVKYILLAPTPRYVSEPCCSDLAHCTNSGNSGFVAEVTPALKSAADLLKNLAGGRD